MCYVAESLILGEGISSVDNFSCGEIFPLVRNVCASQVGALILGAKFRRGRIFR